MPAKYPNRRSCCIYTSMEVFEELPMFHRTLGGRRSSSAHARKHLILLALMFLWVITKVTPTHAQDLLLAAKSQQAGSPTRGWRSAK